MGNLTLQLTRLVVAITLVVSLFLGLAGSAFAADFRGDDTVTIGANEVIDDANVAGPQEPGIPPFWFSFAGQQLPPALLPGIRIGSDAQIAGKLTYMSPVEQSTAITAKPQGGVTYTPMPVGTGDATSALLHQRATTTVDRTRG